MLLMHLSITIEANTRVHTNSGSSIESQKKMILWEIKKTRKHVLICSFSYRKLILTSRKQSTPKNVKKSKTNEKEDWKTNSLIGKIHESKRKKQNPQKKIRRWSKNLNKIKRKNDKQRTNANSLNRRLILNTQNQSWIRTLPSLTLQVHPINTQRSHTVRDHQPRKSRSPSTSRRNQTPSPEPQRQHLSKFTPNPQTPTPSRGSTEKTERRGTEKSFTSWRLLENSSWNHSDSSTLPKWYVLLPKRRRTRSLWVFLICTHVMMQSRLLSDIDTKIVSSLLSQIASRDLVFQIQRTTYLLCVYLTLTHRMQCPTRYA